MDAETIGALITAGSFAISQFISCFFMIKQKKKLRTSKKLNDEMMQTIKQKNAILELPEHMKEVEKEVGEKNGNIKKALVLMRHTNDCDRKEIKYNQELASNYIEYFMETPEKKKKENEKNGKENKTTQESRPENIHEHSEEN